MHKLHFSALSSFIFACVLFLSLSLPHFSSEFLNISVSPPHPPSVSLCPSLSAFSKLNSRVNPCSFLPPEKKGGQRGKDSSLFGISIKMKVAPYFGTPPPLQKKKEDRGRWRKGERQERGAQSNGKRRVKAEQCRKKKKRRRDRETI